MIETRCPAQSATTADSSDPLRQVEHRSAQRRLVPLGVVLPQVQLKIRDPPGVPLVPGQRRRAQARGPTRSRTSSAARATIARTRDGEQHTVGTVRAHRRRPARRPRRASPAPRSARRRPHPGAWPRSGRVPCTLIASRMVLASPTAPPYQQAATPMPPHAKPGRRRYQPSGPTGTAATSTRSIGPDGTSANPRATHPASLVVHTGGRAGRWRTAGGHRRAVCAVIRAWLNRPASEHHGLVPVSSHRSPFGTASTRTPGPSAANTPQVLCSVAPTSSIRTRVDRRIRLRLGQNRQRVGVRLDHPGRGQVTGGQGRQRAPAQCGRARSGLRQPAPDARREPDGAVGEAVDRGRGDVEFTFDGRLDDSSGPGGTARWVSMVIMAGSPFQESPALTPAVSACFRN